MPKWLDGRTAIITGTGRGIGRAARRPIETDSHGQAGYAQEAVGAILFLASPLADYVSGQVLEVTGGL